MSDQEWKVHPFIRLPLHSHECRVCQEYRDHAMGMEKESADRVAEDMARVWTRSGDGEAGHEEKKLREESQNDQGQIEESRRQAEESKRLAESETENTQALVEGLKRSVESESERTPALSVGTEQGHQQSRPGPKETKAPRLPNNGIITKDDPVPTRLTGRGDIVGFGFNGVYILRNQDLLRPHTTKLEIEDFGYKAGWQVNKHPRLIGDTTGDGLADIIGFGDRGVHVARNNGTSFSPPALVTGRFASNSAWLSRYVAGLRGKGYVDIIGFGYDGVFVSLNNGNGDFADSRQVFYNHELCQGWRSDHQFCFADVNGNGILDIVGFAPTHVCVNIGKGDGTFVPSKVVLSTKFMYSNGEWTIPGSSLTLGDLTGNGNPDIIGFGPGGAYAALNNGDGTFQSLKMALDHFGTVTASCGVDRYFIADVNGDGFGDIVAFSNEGVWVAVGNGDGTFQPPEFVTKDFGQAGGGRYHHNPRFVVDLTGNGGADIVGFGKEGVWVSYNDGKGKFGPVQKITSEFSTNCGWNMDNSVRCIANLGYTR